MRPLGDVLHLEQDRRHVQRPRERGLELRLLRGLRLRRLLRLGLRRLRVAVAGRRRRLEGVEVHLGVGHLRVERLRLVALRGDEAEPADHAERQTTTARIRASVLGVTWTFFI